MRSLLQGDSAVPALGMGAIPAQLANTLHPGTVHLRNEVTEVAPERVTTGDGHVVTARRVVVAAEGPRAAALLGLPPVESNPATCVWFAAERPPIDDRYIVLDGTGVGPALNVAVMSNVAPEYAPSGDALIAAACPGVRAPDIESAVRTQLGRMWGPQVDEWRHLRTDVHRPRAAPPTPAVRPEATRRPR